MRSTTTKRPNHKQFGGQCRFKLIRNIFFKKKHVFFEKKNEGKKTIYITGCGARLRGLAPGQHSSEETSQRWRVVSAGSGQAHRLSVWKVWGLIPGPLKSAQCRQQLANAAAFLCYPVAKMTPSGLCKEGGRESPPLTIAEKINSYLILKQTDFSLCKACRLLSCFFCSVQLSNLISRNFHYDAICNKYW